jgi:hypothetical protein
MTIQDHRTIQELLLEYIHTQEEKNSQLRKKIEQTEQQAKTLKQQASNIYDTPSARLSQNPIMNIFTKAVATYMFLRHLNHPQEENEI